LYGVTKTGNFEGRSILHRTDSGSEDSAAEDAVKQWKSKLYAERRRRPRPATDTKVLTSWNGLAISALSFAGAVMGIEGYCKAAEQAAEFVATRNVSDGRLLRRFAGGQAALEGTLEDYAFFAQGLIDLFEATAKPEWLEEALRLTGVMVDDFEDREHGGFFLTVGAKPARLKEGYDGVMPSGNSVAASNLIRLAEVTGLEELRQKGERVLRSFGRDIEQQPSGHPAMLAVLGMLTQGMTEVVITSKERKEADGLLAEVWRRYLPNKVVLASDSQSFGRLSAITKLLEGRRPGPVPRAYVCRNFTCNLPAEDPLSLRSQLDESWSQALKQSQ